MPPRSSGGFSPALVFGFLVVFGAALFLVRPESTRAQVIFRVGVILTGLLGLGVLRVRRRR